MLNIDNYITIISGNGFIQPKLVGKRDAKFEYQNDFLIAMIRKERKAWGKPAFNEKILEAMESIDRKDFIKFDKWKTIYENQVFDLGKDATCSQPSLLAKMVGYLKLEKGMDVLEVGSGCGYLGAIIKRIIGEEGKLSMLEIDQGLVNQSKRNLNKYHFKNFEVNCANGRNGFEKNAPYDRIILSAGVYTFSKEFAKPFEDQLKDRGIAVCPQREGEIKIITKNKLGVSYRNGTYAMFVPLR